MADILTIIDIGTSAVKIVEIEDTEPLKILSLYLFDPELNKISKHEPNETRAKQVRDKIETIIKSNNISTKKILLILKGTKLVTRSYIMPDLSWQEIFQSVKTKILDITGFPEEKVRIFIEPVKIPPYMYHNKVLIKTSAVFKQFIDDSKLLIQETYHSNLSLCSLNESLTGILLLTEQHSGEKVYAIIRISNTSTTIILCRSNIPLMSRTIPTGSINLTRVLTGDIVFDGITLNTSLAEAEEIKTKRGILLEDDYQNDSYKDVPNLKLPAEVTNSLIAPLLESLTTEIKRFLTFARNELELEKIDTLFLTGQGVKLKNLDKYFEKNLSVPVKYLCLNPHLGFKNIELKTEFLNNENIFSQLIGCAINRKKTDFLKKESKLLKLKQNLDKYYALFLFCLLIMCYGFLEMYNQSFKKESTILENIWSKKVVKYSIYFQTQNQKKEYLKTFSTIMDYKKLQMPWLGFFKQLSREKINGIVLTEINLTGAGESEIYPEYTCTLQGNAFKKENLRPETVLSQFIQKLNSSPWIASTEIVKLDTTSQQAGLNSEKRFILKCKLNINS